MESSLSHLTARVLAATLRNPLCEPHPSMTSESGSSLGMTSPEALAKAIAFAGTPTKLAALITEAMPHLVKPVLRQHIGNWLESKLVPANYCPTIERVTGVRCEDLCPTTDWAVLRASGVPVAGLDEAQGEPIADAAPDVAQATAI